MVPKYLSYKDQQQFINDKKNSFLNSKDKFQNTPILCACFKQIQGFENREELIRMLVESGVLFEHRPILTIAIHEPYGHRSIG